MELDDLRRQWREPEPAAPVAMTAAQLQVLLASQRSGLVEKIRRNTRWDVGIGSLVLVLAFIIAMPKLLAFAIGKPDTHRLLAQLFAGVLGLVLLSLVFYYFRMMSILRQLDHTTGSVHSHLVRLCAGLRRLLRFYYYLSLSASPVLLPLLYGFEVGRELARAAGFRGLLMLQLGVGLLVLGALLQVGIVHSARWWVQRLYGQHLDRLEGQVRELEDAEPLEATRG